jgi:class 3 adenylate cyclase
MALKQDLEAQVKKIFADEWSSREGKVVPEPTDLTLGNDAVEFDRATILYADLSGSTKLVDGYKWWFAAEIYKTFLHCAATVVRQEGGVITSYDGDRIMAVFIGKSQTSSAAKCGLKINYAVRNIINPALKTAYPNDNYVVRQVVGIDTSAIRASRTGVRGDNDLVWVGKAANYAAKLTELDLTERVWVTDDAYGRMREDVKMGGNPARCMWKKFTWNANADKTIYGSNWIWSV